jgi:hypothetical protein
MPDGVQYRLGDDKVRNATPEGERNAPGLGNMNSNAEPYRTSSLLPSLSCEKGGDRLRRIRNRRGRTPERTAARP